jgi:hypothetical protein
MKKGIDNRSAQTECWVRKGDAIVDDVNGYSSNDFVNALKSQSASAWIALRAIVFNPVMNEKLQVRRRVPGGFRMDEF